MEKDNSKFQKQSSSFRYYLDFSFADLPSKSNARPLREADSKAGKVVNFVAMWLNLYPHTVNFYQSEVVSTSGWNIANTYCIG